MNKLFLDFLKNNPMNIPSYENILQNRLNEAIGGYSAVFDSPPGIGTHKEKVENPKIDMGLKINDGLEPEDDDEEDNTSATDKMMQTLAKETHAVVSPKEPEIVKSEDSNTGKIPEVDMQSTGTPDGNTARADDDNSAPTQLQPSSVTDAPVVNGLQTRSWADRKRERMDIELDLTRARVKARNQGKTALKGTIADLDDETWKKMKEEKIKTAIESEQNRRVADTNTRNRVNNDLLTRYRREHPEQGYVTPDEAVEMQRKQEWQRATDPKTNPALAAAQAENAQNEADRKKYGGNPNEILAGTKATRKDFYDRTGRAFGGDIRRDSDEAGRMRSEMNAAAEADRKRDRELAADVTNQTVGEGIPVDIARKNALRTQGIWDEHKQNVKDKMKRSQEKYADKQPKMTDIAESKLENFGMPVMKAKINARKI